jgi:hypothetical protein
VTVAYPTPPLPLTTTLARSGVSSVSSTKEHMMILNRAPSHRRSATGVVVVAVMLGALLSGCARPGGPDGSPTSPGASPSAEGGAGSVGTAPESSTAVYGVKLDLVEAGGVLRTTEGQTFQLGTGVGYVVRVPAGWLYGPTDRSGPVNLLRPDGSSKTLNAVIDRSGLDVPAAPAVSSDGRRIAWSKGDNLITGSLTANGITDEASSPAPTGTYPVTWAGSMVVVAQPYAPGCCGHRTLQYDVWDPARGNFVPQWTRDVWPIYGPTSAPLFGTRQTDTTGNGCLVRLNGVQDLSVTATACVPGGLKVGSPRGLLAPDGRHLVEGLDDKIQIFDLSTVTTTKAALRTCPGDWPKAWEDNNTVLIENTTTGVVTRCFVDGGAPATVPGLTLASPNAPNGVKLVPRIG